MPKRVEEDTVIRHTQSAFQKRVCLRLEELDLTPVDAARRIGARSTLIRDVLRFGADCKPGPDVVAHIARALETTSEWLLNGVLPPGSVKDTDKKIDDHLHAKATKAAVQSLETAGLVLDPSALSELILHIYKSLEGNQQA
jgi:hypothetical protein